MRSIIPLGVLVTALLPITGGSLFAHAVVYPATAPTGAYQKYVLRVPNERSIPTTRVEITFPDAIRVISFDEVPGWELETVTAEEGFQFVSAVWTGDLPPGRFVEFGFIGVNPAEETVVQWDVIQTYGEDEPVAWTGPADSSTPASRTTIRAGGEEGDGAPSGVAGGGPASGVTGAAGTSVGSASDWVTPGTALGGSALVLALLALGIALRPSRDEPA